MNNQTAADGGLQGAWQNRVIIALPFVLFALISILLAAPPTRPAALWLLKESHPVELATFVFFLWTGVKGLQFTVRLMKDGATLSSAFFALFSLAMVIIGMEEIAWGQSLFGFETPELFDRINAQQETTLHNIGPLQGRSELFRLAFGLAGLIGLLLNGSIRFRGIAVPPILLPWFLLICGHAVIDIYNDYYPIQQQFDAYMQRTSEVIELYIALCAFLYIRIRAEAGRAD
jgi:hypothetical protein